MARGASAKTPAAAGAALAAAAGKAGEAAKLGKKTPIDLGDTASLKRALDDCVVQVVTDGGYEEDHFVSNVKIALGTVTCLLALVAQFYPKKWLAQWWVLLACVLAYGACTLALNVFITRVEGEVFLFTRPRKGGKALQASSKLPRFSPEYMLQLETHPKAPNSKLASLERSIASYFDVDGFLVEAPFRADVLRTLRAFESQQKKAQ
ncbi:hypothetical protein WJX81_005216 [Elliptochloris bilobata]|uniref:Signal peptidase complex subunit 2 n=1 Tax=Elliptochloris bilobata TaxID=381761 RepID=A0AAW1SCB3_9CHLO